MKLLRAINLRYGGQAKTISLFSSDKMSGFTFCQTIRSLERQTIRQVPQSEITYVTISVRSDSETMSEAKYSSAIVYATLQYTVPHPGAHCAQANGDYFVR